MSVIDQHKANYATFTSVKPEVFRRRQFSVTVNDALCDPNLLKPKQPKCNAYDRITLKPGAMLKSPKDPGYERYNKRGSEQHDCWSKTHFDY